MSPVFKISLLLIVPLTFNGCKQNETNGIEIGQTLYVHQDYQDNKRLRQLIQETLNHNKQGLSELTKFPCGGGAGCYDLGVVLTQIIYRLGEDEFNQMVHRLNNEEIHGLRSLIRAGLEYGDHNNDGQMDNRRIEKEFPLLNETLKK